MAPPLLHMVGVLYGARITHCLSILMISRFVMPMRLAVDLMLHVHIDTRTVDAQTPEQLTTAPLTIRYNLHRRGNGCAIESDRSRPMVNHRMRRAQLPGCPSRICLHSRCRAHPSPEEPSTGHCRIR